MNFVFLFYFTWFYVFCNFKSEVVNWEDLKQCWDMSCWDRDIEIMIHVWLATRTDVVSGDYLLEDFSLFLEFWFLLLFAAKLVCKLCLERSTTPHCPAMLLPTADERLKKGRVRLYRNIRTVYHSNSVS